MDRSESSRLRARALYGLRAIESGAIEPAWRERRRDDRRMFGREDVRVRV